MYQDFGLNIESKFVVLFDQLQFKLKSSHFKLNFQFSQVKSCFKMFSGIKRCLKLKAKVSPTN